MKKGPIILLTAGFALLVLLYFLPVTPTGKVASEDQKTEAPAEKTPDQKVDEALQKLQSGELPPMQAILQIREVADEHPENIRANFTLGVMAIQTGQFDKAIPRFENVIKVDPSNKDAYRMLAQSQLYTGDTTLAVVNYEKALSLAGESEKAALEEELSKLK